MKIFTPKFNIKTGMPFQNSVSFRGKGGLESDTFTRSIDRAPDDIDLISEPVKEVAENCATASKTVKKYYDNLYGEGNWEYVSIGRSLALVANSLEQLGVKSHIIPISGLSKEIQNGEELTKKEGFEEFRNYIYELGLEPSKVKNSNKTYVFQDYADTGATLKRFEEFIKSDEMGLNFGNVVFESVNDVIENSICKRAVSFEEAKKLFMFQTELASQNTIFSMKTYTNVKKLPPDKLKTISGGIYEESAPRKDFERALEYYLKN